MALLRDGSGVMGALVVVTWSPRVARWAKRVGQPSAAENRAAAGKS